MSRVVLRVPVVLRGKMDGQGGTERGTGWYRCRVIDLQDHPVPPASTPSDEEFPFEYPLVPPVPPRGGQPLKLKNSSHGIRSEDDASSRHRLGSPSTTTKASPLGPTRS